MKCGQPKHARLLSPVIEALLSLSRSLARSLSFFLSKKKEVWRIDRVLWIFRSGLVLWRQVVLRGEMCSTNACTWKKRARSALAWPIQVHKVGVALGRVGDTERHGALPYFFDEKEVLSWLHCTCNRKNCHMRQNGCGKVGPQVLPIRIFHKRSPLFQQECLRKGLHSTLEAHESCTFCAGRLIAGKVIKTLQTWRYVWSFTNLWRLNVIKWAGEITNLYKKFNAGYCRPLSNDKICKTAKRLTAQTWTPRKSSINGVKFAGEIVC